MIVCKFGGSSVADAGQIRKVEQIVKADAKRAIIIVSAPGKRNSQDIKITDMLYTCHAEAVKGNSIADLFDQIRVRYIDIAKDLKLPLADLSTELDEIEKNIQAGSSADYAASRGEHLSAKIVAQYLGWEFLETEGVVILTPEGSVAPETYNLMAEKLNPDVCYVVPGFYGSTREGQVKTFSRGGSDISGAIAARAAGAEVYENWTDVSGICMADPRVVDSAKVVKELTYQEIRELASIGAGVFHEEAIAPVRSVKIPIFVKNTNDMQAAGTHIVPERDSQKNPVIGVSGKTGYARIYIRKLMLHKYPEYRLKIETLLKVHGIVAEFSSVGFDSISYYVPGNHIVSEEELVRRLELEVEPDEICTQERLSMIGLVGEGIPAAIGVLGKVSTQLAAEGIAIRYVNYGGSMITCVIGVDDDQYKKALNCMYQAVIN